MSKYAVSIERVSNRIMSENIEQFEFIFKALDYQGAPGLVTGKDLKVIDHKSFIFAQTKKRLDIDSIYFVKETPIIIFKYLSDPSEQQIIDLHKKVWNLGTAPLLFVLLNNELRIYSAYIAPVLKNKKISADDALIASFKNLDKTDDLQATLKNFSRIEVDTGNLWRVYSNFFSNDYCVNQYLLHNLKELRKDLQSKGIDFEFVHNLIARSLIALYFQHRSVFKKDFFTKYDKNFTGFTDLLSSKTALYKFFEDMTNFFGKDVFPVTEGEKKAVTSKHLTILKDYLTHDGSKDSNIYFWAYSFDLIPVEFICSIYEEFLYIEETGKDLASFTPPALARLMLNQVLPYGGKNKMVKILDPACGSSIFLVESYKRLVEKWIINNKITKPDFDELFKILSDSIFGFDYNLEALKFTAVCLFMTLLDFIDAINFDRPAGFGSIIGNNLSENDFFDSKSKLHKNKYDVIIGNPPWQSSYGDKAQDYLKKTDHPVGDKQISQVFLWQSGDLISEDGSICLLMPSKGLLYNFNPKNIEFRDKFFKNFNVKKIINLSLFSNLLFENSKFPASIIIYSLPKPDAKTTSTVYYTPKPSNKFWEFSTLVVDPSDTKLLPKQQILKNHTIWKIAFVGTGRDFLLINHLDKNFPKIDYICEDLNWKYGEGFQLGGGDKNVNKDMAKMLNIPAKSIYPFHVNKEELQILDEETFHRPRDFDLYKAPHTLVRGGQIYAAFIDYDAVFTHAVMSFSSPNPQDADLLKLLAAYLNSSLTLYYLFLTSSTWCIERTDIHLAEYRTLPFTIPKDTKILNNITKAYDDLSRFVASNIKNFHKEEKYNELKDILDNYIFDMFGLDSDQRQIILDINRYSINYFQDYSKSSKSKIIPEAITRPNINNLSSYATLFCNSINRKIRKHNYKLVSIIHSGDYPLEVVSFKLINKDSKTENIQIADNSKDTIKLLKHLDNMVLKQTGKSLYTTKNLSVYEGEAFHLVKPSEVRYWTNTMALNDSDKTLKEILKGFKSSKPAN